MRYRKTEKGIGLSVATLLAVLCLFLSRPAFASAAESGVWTDKSGNQVASGVVSTLKTDAYYSEKLNPTHLSVTVSPRPETGRTELAFLRDGEKTPDAESGVRGLYFGFEQGKSSVVMNVFVVLRTGKKTCLEGYEIGDEVSLEVCAADGGSVIVKADGKRLIADFNDITNGVTSTSYSSVNATYVAVSCSGGASIGIESLTSDDAATNIGSEWLYADKAQSYETPVTLSSAARLTEGQATQKLTAVLSAEKTVSVTFTKSGAFRCDEGAQGFKITLDTASGKYVASAGYMKSKSETSLFRGYETGVTAGGEITVRLRARSDGGFLLELGGTRVLIAGKDPLRLFATEDFSDGQGKTFLAFESEGSVTVKSIEGKTYDDEPTGRDVFVVNESEIGNVADDWTEGVTVDENGVAYICGRSAMKRELSVDYVGFTMDITNLVNTSVADCCISFAVAASDAPENGDTDKSGANGIIFTIKNKDGLFCLAAYERYDHAIRTIIADTSLTDVNVYASLRFELVWYDYELRLFINDSEFVNEYGINPLASYYPKYYRNENKKTYLCFAQTLSVDEGSGLTPENSTRFCVYDVYNVLPEKYRTTEKSATADEIRDESLNAALTWGVAAGVVAAGTVAASVVYICVCRKSARRGKEEE